MLRGPGAADGTSALKSHFSVRGKFQLPQNTRLHSIINFINHCYVTSLSFLKVGYQNKPFQQF